MELKKILIVIFFMIIIGVLLASCTEPVDSASAKRETIENSYFRFMTDEETGCQYIYQEGLGSNSKAAITPRLDSQGKPMCGKGDNQ